jgi:hypothetical protein
VEEVLRARASPPSKRGASPKRRVKEVCMGLKVAKGNFLSASRGLLLAPGNGVVKANGHLVMGAGAAKALAQTYPYLPRTLGRMAQKEPRMGGGWYIYGLLTIQVAPGLHAGVFQSKGDWKTSADLSLIAYSARKLAEWLRENPDLEAHLAFPGVGLGGLGEEEVLEVLEPILGGFPVVLYRL